jgi:hypothetical protein
MQMAPTQVYATLLHEPFTCAPSVLCTGSSHLTTKYVSGGTNSATRKYQKPELLATGPNQVWPWGITKLLVCSRFCDFVRPLCAKPDGAKNAFAHGLVVLPRNNGWSLLRLASHSVLERPIQNEV